MTSAGLTADGSQKVVLISAPTTPFTADGELDLAGAGRLFRYMDPYVDAVLLTGTMGEFVALSESERLALYEVGLEVFGARRVIAHVGTESAHNSLRLARAATGLGLERLALITPYYLPATAQEVAEHFTRVTQEVAAQWYGYLFPERTGITLEPTELARIVTTAGLAGFKISGGSCAWLGEYVAASAPGVEFYSGYDAGLPQAAAVGAAGIVSGFSSAFPKPFRVLVDAINRDDREAVGAAQHAVLQIMSVMGQSIGRAKLAQSLSGRVGPYSRMPVQPPRDDAAIKELVAAYG